MSKARGQSIFRKIRKGNLSETGAILKCSSTKYTKHSPFKFKGIVGIPKKKKNDNSSK